jgi:MFS family permease
MIGRKKTVIIGRVINVIANIVYLFANNFPLFLIGNMLYQTNWAFESGAQSALLYDSLKENNQEKKLYKKTETDTFFYCTVGMVFASVLGGFLYKYGVHMAYAACVVASIISLIITLFFQEPALDSKKFTLKNYLQQNLDGVKHIFENKMIRSISFFSFIITFITYAALWYLYEPRLAVAGFNPELMGLLVAGTYIIRAIGTKLVPVLDKKLKKSQIPIFLAILQSIGSFLSFIPGKIGAITSVYSRKFADGFRNPIVATLQNEQIESKYRATSLSAISLFTNLLIGLAGPIIGLLNDRYGPSVTLGIFGFIGIIVCLPLAVNLSNMIKKYNYD